MNANGIPNHMGYGFNGQANFGMGMNMPNMMNPGWNNMGRTSTPSRYRSCSNRRSGYGMNNMNGMNGMFGFGGNMGMGMNDMSMNYGGNFGNGWNGMGGGGYGFNGYNHSAGYNQSGAYSEMMNQYPKNNMNRLQGNGMGNFPQQQNRSGSFGAGYGSSAGMQHNSRPGSRAGPNKVRRFSRLSLPKIPKAPHLPIIKPPRSIAADKPVLKQSEGGSRAGTTDPTTEGKDMQASVSAEPSQEGKAETAAVQGDNTAGQATAGGTSEEVRDVTDANAAGPEGEQSSGLNQIQTVESVEMEDQGFDPSMMGGNMQYPQMVNSFNSNQMNGAYNHQLGNMGYHNNFGPRGGFNNAYGAATVLTGEPRGVGVAGAPTGPRAMREGRPNTGFSSRANNVRFNPAPSATPAAEAPAGSRSPPRRARS